MEDEKQIDKNTDAVDFSPIMDALEDVSEEIKEIKQEIVQLENKKLKLEEDCDEAARNSDLARNVIEKYKGCSVPYLCTIRDTIDLMITIRENLKKKV